MATYPANTNNEAIELNIQNANQFHKVLQGNITDFIETYEGEGDIPSVAKAMYEAAAYKVGLPWEQGTTETDLLQPRIFGNEYYVPLQVPAVMGEEPVNSSWRLYRPYSQVQQLIERQTGADISSGFSTLENIVFKPGTNNLAVFVNRTPMFSEAAVGAANADYRELSNKVIEWTNTSPDPSDEITFVAGEMVSGVFTPVDVATLDTVKLWNFAGDGNSYSIDGALSELAEAYVVVVDNGTTKQTLQPYLDYSVQNMTLTTTANYTGTDLITVVAIAQPLRLAETGTQVFLDTTAGLSATIDGDYFYTPSSDLNKVTVLYLNDNGVATEVGGIPSQDSIDNLEIRLINLIKSTTGVDLGSLSLDFTNQSYVAEV